MLFIYIVEKSIIVNSNLVMYGKNLSVVIKAKTNQNWKPFGAWYSAKKYLPEAKIYIALERQGGGIGIEWIKKLKIPYMTFNSFDPKDEISNNLELCKWTKLSQPILLMTSESFIVREFKLNNLNKNLNKENIWFINQMDYDLAIENYRLKGELPFSEENDLACDMRTNNFSFITYYHKGIGGWINSMTECPFTNEKLLKDEITLNVNKAIELWTEMADYYNQII